MKTHAFSTTILKYQINNNNQAIVCRRGIGMLILFLSIFLPTTLPASLPDEDGSRLWLRMDRNTHNIEVKLSTCRSATTDIAIRELQHYWHGQTVILKKRKYLERDAFEIKGNMDRITITGGSDIGILYGVYHLLRLQQTESNTQELNIREKPQYATRVLNHWDNPDGTIERGYAGRSLWQWNELPEKISPRYEAYARANASIGINTVVLNNVNASPYVLSDSSLLKVKALADVFRPYGIRVCLSVNFASPIVLGKLKTADPLNNDVRLWWRKKVKYIYSIIPDFGGFLVKANSEGQPGPGDYKRSHADGANMIANAIKPYHGIVMWRAFVYNNSGNDRARQAYDEFMPLDGKFADNVILQVKNGPIDFQPREPYSPLFTSLQHTPMMVEMQITQEYLGFSNHLVFLAPTWHEFFSYVSPSKIIAIAGVSNIGDDVNWCGHHFAQANWYAFGRLAWNPRLTSKEIAKEWLCQTFTCDTAFTLPMTKLMVESRETAVNYMMPLGLHHIFAWGHHYGPEPWCNINGARADWLPPYYHRADSTGIGFDRTTTGSDAVSQYPDSLARIYNDISSCPDNLLLWFHHVTWTHTMHSGKTLWDELCHKYDIGVKAVREMQRTWDAMEPYVDQQRFADVQRKLRTQERDAVWWHDACLLYFQTFSKLPIPTDVERPVHNLDDMMQFHLNITNYECPKAGYNE